MPAQQTAALYRGLALQDNYETIINPFSGNAVSWNVNDRVHSDVFP
jgi:hypothetical protein